MAKMKQFNVYFRVTQQFKAVITADSHLSAKDAVRMMAEQGGLETLKKSSSSTVGPMVTDITSYVKKD